VSTGAQQLDAFFYFIDNVFRNTKFQINLFLFHCAFVAIAVFKVTGLFFISL
jgi:hypothetical protein